MGSSHSKESQAWRIARVRASDDKDFDPGEVRKVNLPSHPDCMRCRYDREAAKGKIRKRRLSK